MILIGRVIADQIENEIKEKIESLTVKPSLAVILVGYHLASHTYVNVKRLACKKVGIESNVYKFQENVTEKELLSKIDELNRDTSIHGILIQLPLPRHINQEKIMESVDPSKDIDGFHPVNMGKLLLGIKDGFIPCTPLGIKTLLERSSIDVSGKHVVIVGRSNIVGKPLAALLMQKEKGANATVTVAHSGSRNLSELTNSADILISAIGSPNFIKESMVKEGAVVIDVGINRIDDASNPKGWRLVGDVDFNNVEKKCLAITPVPKGVGPMTVAMLLLNTYTSFLRCVSSF